MTCVIAAAEEIATRLPWGSLTIIESTLYPGATEELVIPILERSTGERPEQHLPVSSAENDLWKAGEDFFLGVSPERVDPGRTDWTVTSTPRLVAGATHRCLSVTRELYETSYDVVVPVSSPTTAETAKILENAFRAVNIAFINETAIAARYLGVDIWEVIEAASTKPFGFMKFFPGPGVGGNCIPVNPRFLSWKLERVGYDHRSIRLSSDINGKMPVYISDLMIEMQKARGIDVDGSTVLVVGVTYKPNVADTRESPAVDILEYLDLKGAKVFFNDPLIETVVVNGRELQSTPLNDPILGTTRFTIVITPQQSYDWQEIADSSALVLDTSNAMQRAGIIGDHIVHL